jgi:hypothetical protein
MLSIIYIYQTVLFGGNVMEFIQAFAMFLSFVMCLFLLSYAYMEGLRISNSEGNVQAGSFLFSATMGLVFAFFTVSLY